MNGFQDLVLDWLGTNKYRPIGACLTSDYVLVNMITVFAVCIGVCAISASFLLTLCYRNGQNMLRLSVVVLKDPGILKLLSIYLGLLGVDSGLFAITVHYAVFNLFVLGLAMTAGVSTWTVARMIGIAFDQTRQASILSDILTNASGEIADYGQPPVDGRYQEQLPQLINNPLPEAKNDG